MKYFVIALGIIVIFSLGCVQSTNNFSVAYKADYSSGAGTRYLDIVYTVENGNIVSCEGTYSSPATADQRAIGDFNNNIEPCQLAKLLAGNQYNVPFRPITEIGFLTQTEGNMNDGAGHYSWKVMQK